MSLVSETEGNVPCLFQKLDLMAETPFSSTGIDLTMKKLRSVLVKSPS